MITIAGGILIAAAVLFALYVSWGWLAGRRGGVPERHDWIKGERRPDPRFDEWSAFNQERPDTSSPCEQREKRM
jgi:hypothetical protein